MKFTFHQNIKEERKKTLKILKWKEEFFMVI